MKVSLMKKNGHIATKPWGVDARTSTPAWAALRTPDAPALARPVAFNDLVLTLSQLLFQFVGIILGAGGALALSSGLELTLVAGFFTLLLGMVLGGFLATLLERAVNQRAVQRWREQHEHDQSDVPLVILSPYRYPTSASDLIDTLDRLNDPAGPHADAVHREELTKAQKLVMRALHAQQIDHRADATRIAATTYLNSLTNKS